MSYYSVDDMRDDISKVYAGPEWKKKVKRMSDRQVMAIYYSFCENGKFDKKTTKLHNEKPRESVQANEPEVYFQADIAEQLSFDI